MNYLKLFIFAISLAYKFAFSETIKCFLDNLNPNLGIYQGNTNINVILQCNIYNTTLIQNLLHGARIYFGSNSIIVNKDSIYFEGYISEFGYTPQLIASEVSWSYSIRIKSPPLNERDVILVNISDIPPPASTSNPKYSILVDGSLPFQFYNIPDFNFKFLSDVYPLQSFGGQTICLEYDRFSYLISTKYARISFYQADSDISVYYQLNDGNYLNTSNPALCALLDSQMNKFDSTKELNVNVSLNGVDYTFTDKQKLEATSGKKALIFFEKEGSGVQFSSWAFQHTSGLLSETAKLDISLEIAMNYEVDLYDQKSADEIKYYVSLKNYSVVIFTSFVGISILSEVATAYPDIRFVACVYSLTGESAYKIPNLSSFWAELYQARYLTGIVTGKLFSKGGKICYVKPYNEPESNLALNSFASGVLKANPNLKVDYWTANTFGDTFKLDQISAYLLEVEKCDTMITHTFVAQSLFKFVSASKFISTSNNDARLILGDYVSVSAQINWEASYKLIFRTAFSNKPISATHTTLGLDDGSVFISDRSGLIPPEVRLYLYDEEKLIAHKGAARYILCGPVVDINNNTQIPSGTCPNLTQLYTMNWDIQNTVSRGTFQYVPPKYDDKRLSATLVAVTHAFFGIFCFFLVSLGVWVYYRREHRVVKFAQPQFLYLVLFGCLIGIATVFPLQKDKLIEDQEAYDLGVEGIESIKDESLDHGCQSVFWLLVTGFGVTFPTLMAKTWRLHRILGSMQKSLSFNIKTYSKFIPVEYIALGYLFILYIPMVVWQIVDPLTYSIEVINTDSYGNPTSSEASCYKNTSFTFPAIIMITVLGSCVIAIVICFIARNDETINNEITYISLAVFNYFQIFIISIPLIVFAEDSSTEYIISVAAVYIAFIGVACLIFLPKVVAVEFKDEASEAYTISNKTLGFKGNATNTTATNNNIMPASSRNSLVPSFPPTNHHQQQQQQQLNETDNPIRQSELSSRSTDTFDLIVVPTPYK